VKNKAKWHNRTKEMIGVALHIRIISQTHNVSESAGRNNTSFRNQLNSIQVHMYIYVMNH
jgi:hypothetical protein